MLRPLRYVRSNRYGRVCLLVISIAVYLVLFHLPVYWFMQTESFKSRGMQEQWLTMQANVQLATQPSILLLGDSTVQQLNNAVLNEKSLNASLGGSSYLTWREQALALTEKYPSVREVVIGFSQIANFIDRQVTGYSFYPAAVSWPRLWRQLYEGEFTVTQFMTVAFSKLYAVRRDAQFTGYVFFQNYLEDSDRFYQARMTFYSVNVQPAAAPHRAPRPKEFFIQQLHDLLAQKGVRLTLMQSPLQSGTRQIEPYSTVLAQFRDVCRRLPVNCLDYSELVADEYFSQDGVHLSGNHLARRQMRHWFDRLTNDLGDPVSLVTHQPGIR